MKGGCNNQIFQHWFIWEMAIKCSQSLMCDIPSIDFYSSNDPKQYKNIKQLINKILPVVEALPEYFCMYLTLCVSWLPSWNQLTIGAEAAITAACMLTVLFSATVHDAGFTMNLGAASRRSAMLKNKKKCWVSSIIIHY